MTKEELKMIAFTFAKEGYNKSLIADVLGIDRSIFYYKPKEESSKGKAKSRYTMTYDGELVANSKVVEQIKELLVREFVDYGYLKVTYWLRQNYFYKINPKKVYRLMRENGLLNKLTVKKKRPRNWVKQLLPPTKQVFDYLEFDIKYMYVAGLNRNAHLITVIDVKSRWVLAQYVDWSVRKGDVIKLFDQIFEHYPLPLRFYVRCDNGSQFIAEDVQKYFEDKQNVTQEFCKPATPEQNAHIESYHSILERVICQKYEFESLKELQATMNRFVAFYNFERIHSGVGYISPFKYLENNDTFIDQTVLESALDSSSLQTHFLV